MPFQDVPFCDLYGNICFKKHMKFSNNELMCNCPVECNLITYEFSVSSTPLDPEDLCPPDYHHADMDESLMEPFYEKNPPQFMRQLVNVKNNVSVSNMEYCKNNIKNIAVVTFRMATDIMPVTVMSRRLSFFDKMSAFGKYS